MRDEAEHAATSLSSPLEGEEAAARFMALGNKSKSPRQVGGALSRRISWPLPPTPALPLKGGGRETGMRDLRVGGLLGLNGRKSASAVGWVKLFARPNMAGTDRRRWVALCLTQPTDLVRTAIEAAHG